MATLTICNHKGGTGKTTSSVNLAAAFGLMGHRVLIIDLDPQGFLTRTLGVKEPSREASSLALLDPSGDLRGVSVTSLRHFDVLGASMAMTREQRRLTRPTDVFWLRETLLQGHDYDLVLVDTAAAVSVYTMNALVASDAVVIPVTPEYQPVVGAEQTWQTAALVRGKLNPGLQVPRFLLTQVDGRLSRHTRYADYLQTRYETHVLETPIRTSSALATASRSGETVFDVETRFLSRGALDYAHAAEEILRTFFPPLVRPAPVEGSPMPEEDDTPPLSEEDAEANAIESLNEQEPAPDADFWDTDQPETPQRGQSQRRTPPQPLHWNAPAPDDGGSSDGPTRSGSVFEEMTPSRRRPISFPFTSPDTQTRPDTPSPDPNDGSGQGPSVRSMRRFRF
ncbi:MAG: AAA family ATPase [Bacteroidota bacterium]